MARSLRNITPGVPQHIIQRGNNRQRCFMRPQDFVTYLNYLKVYSSIEHVEVHAWVLMPNHVHLLCTAKNEQAISKMMQSIGRRYVRYFNYMHERTGTLWEGRFKSFAKGIFHFPIP